MTNPIQDLLDEADSSFDSDGLEEIAKELICTAFSRGVNAGGVNVVDYYIAKIEKHRDELNVQYLLELLKETKEKLNHQANAGLTPKVGQD